MEVRAVLSGARRRRFWARDPGIPLVALRTGAESGARQREITAHGSEELLPITPRSSKISDPFTNSVGYLGRGGFFYHRRKSSTRLAGSGPFGPERRNLPTVEGGSTFLFPCHPQHPRPYVCSSWGCGFSRAVRWPVGAQAAGRVSSALRRDAPATLDSC